MSADEQIDRYLRFEVEGYDRWDVDEDAPHLGVPVAVGSGACPHCGGDIGRIEVPLVPLTGEPVETIVYCRRWLLGPLPHVCGGPIALVPIMTWNQLEDE